MASKLLLSLLFVSVVFGYDYYKFAVELPGAVCDVNTCSDSYMGELPKSKLNMHGLWPNNNDKTMVEDCLANNYDESKFESAILEELNTEWVGLYNPSTDFRNHEWGKHGTCWAQAHQNTFMSQAGFLGLNNYGFDYYASMNAYFKLAMSLKDNSGIDAALFPDQSSYQASLATIKAKISQALGVENFDVYCKSYNGQKILTEIRWCLDLDYKPMECPSQITQCSSSGVISVVQLPN